MRIRERMPLRLTAEIEIPGGTRGRWAGDTKDPSNLMSGLSFTTTMPGGFEQASCNLQRHATRNWPDLSEFATVRWRGLGGQIAFEGRIQASPRASGDQSAITPEIVGWVTHLDDYTAAREIYLDPDFNSWQASSLQRKINLTNALIDCEDASVAPDPSTAVPALVTSLTGAWSRAHICEAQYDAKGIRLGTIYYAWRLQQGATSPPISPADTNWVWAIYLADDTSVPAGQEQTPSLRAAGPGMGSFPATTTTRTCAGVYLWYTLAGAAGAEGMVYPLDWTYLGVTGRSGVPIRGTQTASGGLGVLASEVIANAIARWAPRLQFTTGPQGTIQPTTYLIPKAVYMDPTTVSNIIKDVGQYDLLDWAVWEGPTFYMNYYAQRGRSWCARIREAQLQDAGPQVDRIYNAVIVTFTDPAGVAHSVGPPGSAAQYTDLSLYDSDPLNLATKAGLLHWSPPLDAGTTNLGTAIQVGARYLQELKQSPTAGQASLVGYVQDATTGIDWPSWMVRAGDSISFVDASNPAFRRVVRTSYDDASKTNGISLDSPPDDMQAFLQRINASVINLV